MSDKPKCGANKSGGRGLCESIAGAGTSHYGVGRCQFHGGASMNGNKAAVREQNKAAVREQMASLATEVDVDPLDVLLGAIRRAWGAVQWCGSVIGQIEQSLLLARQAGDLETVVIQEKRLIAFQAIYGEWIDRGAKHSKLALDAGVNERLVRQVEQQANLLASVIKAVLGDLNLSEEQQAIAGPVMRKHLEAIDTLAS